MTVLLALLLAVNQTPPTQATSLSSLATKQDAAWAQNNINTCAKRQSATTEQLNCNLVSTLMNTQVYIMYTAVHR